MASFPALVRDQWRALPQPTVSEGISKHTYVVTGSNTGLGYECAKHLMRLGAGRIILAVRSPDRGNDALAKLRQETDRPDAGEVWELDQSSFASVEAFSKKISTLSRLDAFIANAGIAMQYFSLAEGFEASVAVNVLSTMLLAIRVFPLLRDTASRFGVQTNLTVVSSSVGLGPKGVLEELEGNMFRELSKESASMAGRYELTKQMQIYAARQLASLLPVSKTGVVVNYLNPGLCVTELDRNVNAIIRIVLWVNRTLIGRTAEEGSRTLFHAAFAGPDTHGKYLTSCQIAEHDLPSWMVDESGQRTQRRLWDDLLETLKAEGHGVSVVDL